MQPPYGPLGLVGVVVVRRGEEGERAGEEMEGRERATLSESKRESPCLSPSHIRSSERRRRPATSTRPGPASASPRLAFCGHRHPCDLSGRRRRRCPGCPRRPRDR